MAGVNYDILFIVLLLGIPLVLFGVSFILYMQKKKRIRRIIDFANDYVKGNEDVKEEKDDSHNECDQLWNTILDIENVVNGIIKEIENTREDDISRIKYYLESICGIVNEARQVKESGELDGEKDVIVIDYIFRFLIRIEHAIRCIKKIEKNGAAPDYLDSLVIIIKSVNNKYLNNDEVSIKSYIQNRVDPAIRYYNEKMIISSMMFNCLSIMQIIYSALIPVSLMISDSNNSSIVGAIYGASLTITSGINVFGKFKEKLLQYHDLRDKLFIERNLYIAGRAYKYVEFVDICENIMRLEHKNIVDFLSDIETNKAVTDKKDNKL
ncbi:MAG: SLATT domain-containing protein [Lachnospiraceae bacterium]|nr:SLATT domain-containing protein [Lachnospiraceae bacterium]